MKVILFCCGFTYSSSMRNTDLSAPGIATVSWMAAALIGEPLAIDRLVEIDSEQLVQLVIDHGVASLLHHVLSQSGSGSGCSTQLRELLTRPARQNIALDMLRLHDLGPLLTQLDDAGIRYLLIKGTGLAFTHYQRPYLRERCDTDILFADRGAYDQAWKLLESLGYQRRKTLSGKFVGYQHCCWRRLGTDVHQVLDCHIKINDYLFYADTFGFEELMEHSICISQLADSARTLGPVHAMLMACIHHVATIPTGNANRLIWLFDMYLLAKSFTGDNWGQFLDLARDRSICGTCKYSLDVASEFFPVAVSAEVMAALGKAAESEPFKPDADMKRWAYYFYVFKFTRDFGSKARLIREHFLPSAEYLMEKYQTHNRLALPFLCVHRVIAGLRRYF